MIGEIPSQNCMGKTMDVRGVVERRMPGSAYCSATGEDGIHGDNVSLGHCCDQAELDLEVAGAGAIVDPNGAWHGDHRD